MKEGGEVDQKILILLVNVETLRIFECEEVLRLKDLSLTRM